MENVLNIYIFAAVIFFQIGIFAYHRYYQWLHEDIISKMQYLVVNVQQMTNETAKKQIQWLEQNTNGLYMFNNLSKNYGTLFFVSILANTACYFFLYKIFVPVFIFSLLATIFMIRNLQQRHWNIVKISDDVMQVNQTLFKEQMKINAVISGGNVIFIDEITTIGINQKILNTSDADNDTITIKDIE